MKTTETVEVPEATDIQNSMNFLKAQGVLFSIIETPNSVKQRKSNYAVETFMEILMVESKLDFFLWSVSSVVPNRSLLPVLEQRGRIYIYCKSMKN